MVCRSEYSITNDIRKKLALFCNVPFNSVIEALDASTIYDVPILMRKEKLDERVLTKFKLPHKKEPDINEWKQFLGKLKNPTDSVTIGLVGKYIELQDAYKSIMESFIHAGVANECKVNIKWIHSVTLENDTFDNKLSKLDGILVAPGFGKRGIEGKIIAVKYARENNVPFFGICLGMQCAVIEFARNVLGKKQAHSSEIAKTPHPVIDMLESQKNIQHIGGTMRLGAYVCELKKESKVYLAYGLKKIKERHRHRYEFNNKYLKEYAQSGMVATGVNPETNLVEIMEIKNHPWFVGTQYHPELKSTVANPHPLFVKFIKASQEKKKSLETNNTF